MPAGKPSGFSFSSMGLDAGINVGVSIVMASISARLNRKSLKDFDFPEIDPTRKIPYVCGTVKLDSPQIIDWYDFKRSQVRFTTSNTLAFLTGGLTGLLAKLLPFGYRYYLGLTIAMCLGEDVVLEKVYAADKTIYSGSVTGGSTFTIDAHGAFGNEGGMYAVCDFVDGTYTQSRNAYYATQRPHPPAHRGVAVLYYGGPGRAKGRDAKIKYSGYVSRTNYIRPFAFKVRRCPDLLGDGFHNINGEANPAHVIVDLLTSTIYGMGVPTSQIDLDSLEAASETLYNEGYGTSFVWDRDEAVEGVLQRMVDLCDGALFTSPTTGKWTFNLIRPDYDPDDLPVLDESNIVSVDSYITRTPDEAVNEVRIDFLEIASDFKKQTATWRSITNQRIRREREPVTLSHPVGNKTTANKLATREGLALALPLKHITIKVNREAYNYTPGMPFRFSWPEYGIVQETYRVSKINLGSLTDNTITLNCVLDRFGFGAEMYGETVDLNWTNPVEADSELDDADPQVVNSVSLAAPLSPQNGDAYIVDIGATGAFAGHDGEIATFFNGTWTFTSQDDNTRVYNEADGRFYDVSGGTWTDAQVGLLTGDVAGYLPDLTVVGLRTQPLADDLLDEGETWVMGPSGELIPVHIPTAGDALPYAVDAAGTDAYSITLSPAITSYTDGMIVSFKAATANTGAATLSIDGLTAKNIVKSAGGLSTALATNDIRAGQIVIVQYSSAADNFQMQSLLGNVPTAGTTINATDTVLPKRTSSTTFGDSLLRETGGEVVCTNGGSLQNIQANKIWTGGTGNDDFRLERFGGLVVGGNLVMGWFDQGAYLTNANKHAGQIRVNSSNGGGGGTFAFPNQTQAQITSNQNDYSLGSESYFVRLSSDASRDITGLRVPADGFGNRQVDGEPHLIVNVGSNDIVLKNESASSSAANRFTNSTGADITLSAKQAADIIYDGTLTRWLVFKRS